MGSEGGAMIVMCPVESLWPFFLSLSLFLLHGLCCFHCCFLFSFLFCFLTFTCILLWLIFSINPSARCRCKCSCSFSSCIWEEVDREWQRRELLWTVPSRCETSARSRQLGIEVVIRCAPHCARFYPVCPSVPLSALFLLSLTFTLFAFRPFCLFCFYFYALLFPQFSFFPLFGLWTSCSLLSWPFAVFDFSFLFFVVCCFCFFPSIRQSCVLSIWTNFVIARTC